MAKQVRLTLAKAIARANLHRAEVGEKPTTMNELAVQVGVAGEQNYLLCECTYFANPLEFRGLTCVSHEFLGACPHRRHYYPPRGDGRSY